MSTETGIAPSDPEVERRIGRNLLVYQRIENGLKLLLARSFIEGTASDAVSRMAERTSRMMRKNLGEAAKAVFEQVLTDDPPPVPDAKVEREPVISTRFTIASHPDYPDSISALRTQCKAVVDARNDLVHHFLRQVDLQSTEDVKACLARLDEQYEAAQVVRDRIDTYLRVMLQHMGEMAEYMASEGGQRALDLVMSEGRVINVLTEVAQGEPRADGWTFLSTARHRVQAAVPADVELLRDETGPNWLRLLLARCSDLFEASSEPTPNDPSRSLRDLYRIRDSRTFTDQEQKEGIRPN